VLIGFSGFSDSRAADQHAREPRQIGRQVFGDPVGEILLLGVVAEISKR
jgi:hypothetical protein